MVSNTASTATSRAVGGGGSRDGRWQWSRRIEAVGRFRYRLGCLVGLVIIVEFCSYGLLLHVLSDSSPS